MTTEMPNLLLNVSNITADEVIEIINARVQVLELGAKQLREAAELWRECATVTLRDGTPDWKVRASRALRAQLEERYGTLEPEVEASLRAHEHEHEMELNCRD